MVTKTSEYIDVGQRISELGCHFPQGLAFLPTNFESASLVEEFRQPSEAATLKKLLRGAGLTFDEIVDRQQRPAYIQNNSFEWVAPTVFVSATLLTENPNAVAIALNVISNYATDFFKGISGAKSVRLNIVVEKSESKTCTKISYEGDVDGLSKLPEIVRGVADE